ncbi:MAG: hypothetical protein K9M57_09560 [Phycisphaerae bacterium]|nr:hypothetical protein [Phycisphaerae bacterium]
MTSISLIESKRIIGEKKVANGETSSVRIPADVPEKTADFSEASGEWKMNCTGVWMFALTKILAGDEPKRPKKIAPESSGIGQKNNDKSDRTGR